MLHGNNRYHVKISTHATHKGGDVVMFSAALQKWFISTHATHKGGDILELLKLSPEEMISTHATHKGGDKNAAKMTKTWKAFQLTPPIRVATNISCRT